MPTPHRKLWHLLFSHHWLAVFSTVAITLSQVCLVKEDKSSNAGAESIKFRVHSVAASAAAGTVVLTSHSSTATEFTCFSPCGSRLRKDYICNLIIQTEYVCSRITHLHADCIGLRDR